MKLAGPTSIRQKVALPLVLTTAVPLLLSLLALAMLGSLRGGTTAIVGLAFASSLVGSWLWVSRFCGRIAGSLDLMTRQSAAAAAGDLEGRLDPEGSDEIAALGRAVDAACERLGSMVARVRQTSLSLGEAAASLEAATDAIIVRTTKQDSAIEETVESIEEMDRFSGEVNVGAESLAERASDTSSSVLEMDSSIREIATHMDELSEIIDATASSVVQMTTSGRETARHSEILRGATLSTAASMEVLAGSVDQVGANAQRSHELCESATEQAESGSRSVEQTIEGMEKIRQSFEGLDVIIERLADKSKSIGEVVKVIDGVVEQTNLLALNAAIISSHAGEHGRAFAVVADEMRSLAKRTAGSTSEIASLIDGVQSEVSQAVNAMRDGGERVGEGVILSSQAGGILRAISESSRQTTTMVSEIVQSAATQADDIGQVRTAMAQLKEIADLLGSATREQDRSSVEIRRAVERMRQLGQDVKRSTQEQSKESGIIAEAVEAVSDRIQQISRAGAEQKLRSERMREALQLFRSVVVESLDGAMDMKHTLAQLSKGSKQLDEELSRFSG